MSGGRNTLLCGPSGHVECAATQYCKAAPDPACGSRAIDGVCDSKPVGCADIYHGVCGCDNRTYGNECEAQKLGVALKAEGNCGLAECLAAGGHVVNSTQRCNEDEDSWELGRGVDISTCCRKIRIPGAK